MPESLQPPIVLSHTTKAVGDAVARHRRARGLNLEELSSLTARLGYDVDADNLRWMEEGRAIITVDDVMVLTVALGVSPAELLSHIPATHRGAAPIATVMPEDVEQPELRAWIEGRTSLDRDSRIGWLVTHVDSARLRLTHHADQYEGARAVLKELGDLALQESDAALVVALRDEMRRYDKEVTVAADAMVRHEGRLSFMLGDHAPGGASI